MKSLSLALIAVVLLTTSCDSDKNKGNKKGSESKTEEVQFNDDLKESFEDTSVTLSIGKSSLIYLAVHYTHIKNNSGFEIIDRETNELAARFVANNVAENKKWDADKKILSLDGGASVIVDNLNLSKELIYRNLSNIQRDFSKEITNGQLIIRNKNPDIDGIFIKKITDAPVLFRPDTASGLHPSLAATYDSTVSGKRYLIKRSNKSENSEERFDLLESINLQETVEADFKVDSKVELLGNGYSLIEFKVSNSSTDKSFLISNPFNTVDFKCRKIGSPFAISSYREGINTIVTKMVLKTSSAPECLAEATESLEGFLFVFDENLNSMKINY